ncbi:hypothetical protein BDY24DRAFT_361243 [Mrakia frigida]|uniref:uncharacterized protein n=1 Tax=Mrakia frigida TaxID=29902 RepID=UPI003FCBF75B
MLSALSSPIVFSTALLALSTVVRGQVIATNPNGETNPSSPELAEPGAAINQTSMARLLTLNGIDDFCLFGPPEEGPDSLIGNVEPIVVAYCLQARNNARLIPDGTIYSAHFIKTPLYVQIQGFFDGTKINIPYGDDGGELDPHGAENLGNPIGGNVTSNVSGEDVFYEEWMSFMSYNRSRFRICTAETDDISAALQCEHELDVMGCQFVMPGDYTNNSFTSCDGDAAVAPGLYPQADGSTSTFRQRFVGTYTDDSGAPQTYTVGQTVTPAGPFSTPATSNCQTFTSISNGIPTNGLVPTGGVVASGSSAVASASSAVQTGASASGSAASGSAASGSRSSTRGTSATGALASGASASASATSAAGAGFKSVSSNNGVFALLATGAFVGLGGLALLL